MGLKPPAKKTRKSRLDGLQSVQMGWKDTFRQGEKDLYPCPSCGKGRLSPDFATFQKRETTASARSQVEDDDPYATVSRQYRFAGLLVCSTKFCKDVVTVSGQLDITTSTREADDDYGQSHEYTHEEIIYQPDSLVPAPRLFVAPKKCPQEITTELDRAFRLFWVDDRACANSIRSAVELFMDDQKVPRTFIDRKAQKRRSDLHHRIEEWGRRANRDKLAKFLMAIKFIGNEGSHGGKGNGLTRDDLFDGFTFFRHVLDTIFSTEDHVKALETIAERINKRKKPRSQHG
jgi:hypothetical protein